MIAVEYPPCFGQIEVIFRVNAPGNLGQPVQIVTGNAIFRGALFQHLQFFEFIPETLLHSLGWLQLCHALLETLHVCGLVVLGHAQLTLDDLELFLQEELALVLLYLGVDLFADFRLQPSDFLFLAHQEQDLFHAAEQGNGVQHILQFVTRSAGHRGAKVGKRRTVIRPEPGQVLFYLLAVQRIGAQQFLDRADNGEGVGLEFVCLFFRFCRIFHFNQVRRFAAQPLDNPKALKPLGDELNLAAFILGMMYAHGAADGLQLFASRNACLRILFFHKTDTHDLVVGFANPLQGFLPRILVDHHRLHLGREKRTVRNRQHVHAPGHHLLGQGKALAVLVLADIFGHVLFEFL